MTQRESPRVPDPWYGSLLYAVMVSPVVEVTRSTLYSIYTSWEKIGLKWTPYSICLTALHLLVDMKCICMMALAFNSAFTIQSMYSSSVLHIHIPVEKTAPVMLFSIV